MARMQLSALALALVVSSPIAALAQVDVSGDWAVTIESPQGTTTIDASMKQAGEDLTGTITSPLGAVDFKGKVLKDALNVSYTLDLQGNTIEITMTGTVTGDSIAGNLNFGGLGEVPWTAKRKNGAAAAAAPAAAPAASSAEAAATAPGDVSGKWDVTFNMAGNPMPATATFTQSGDKVAGTFTSQAGETAVAGTMTGNLLRLEFNVETQQGQITISMTGDVSPTAIAGKASIVGIGDAEWTATRAK